MSTEWRIPEGTLRALESAPTDRPVMLLMRHSVRPPLPPGSAGDSVPLTEVGVALAEDLGRRIGERLASVRHSPVLRCAQTAEALSRGAGKPFERQPDRLLGHPGALVAHPKLAWEETWTKLPYEELMNAVVDGKALRGFNSARRAAGRILEHMTHAAASPGVHVFVTHDSVLLAVAASLLGHPLRRLEWPWYLDTLAVWASGSGSFELRYRERSGSSPPDQHLIDDDDALEETRVLSFARPLLEATAGLEFPGRVLFAGGAFKSLLHGRPSGEVDLWASSDADRRALLARLRSCGAVEQPGARAFGQAFVLGELTVDVPYRVEPGSLGDRFGRFDLALSAIGVELDHGRLRVQVHPAAREAVRRREVLFLEPLVNWKYAFSSLERARRYAAELAYSLAAEAEQVVWNTYESRDAAEREAMLARFRAHGRGGWGVAEEISCRLA
ncbi:MAG TPA: histidine phosphatase family protein [Myxococcales bacterium]|jgi:broad specificity phosphatase PhoE